MLVTAAPRFGADGEVTGVVEVLFPAQAEVALSDEIERIANAVSEGKLDQRVPEEASRAASGCGHSSVNRMLDAFGRAADGSEPGAAANGVQ